MFDALSLYPMITKKNIALILVSFVIVLFFITVLKNDSSYELVLSDHRTDHVFSEHTVEVGDEIKLSWIHSVEKTPWEEVYIVTEDRQFNLTTIKVASFGAGVPHQKGVTTIEDGFVKMSDINERFEHLHWIHSHNTNYEIAINGHTVTFVEDLPHHIPIEMTIKEG